MALLSLDARKKRFKYLGLGDYNKANILKFQKKAFSDKSQHDGIYGTNTDNALRTWYNVKKYAPDFSPLEFRCGCGGKYCKGYPTYMKQVTLKHIQSIRSHYKKPITVTCGMRCKGYNKACNGSIDNSLHLVGRAVDFYQFGVTDTLENRKKSIKWIKTLPNHHYTYGNGINSNGYSVYAPYMGNALHTDTNKAKKTVSPYHSDKVIIGQACCNEYGTLSGGKPGDQTGHEVQMNNWSSSYGWLYVYRHKDKDTRLKIAQYAIDTCNNNNIGYNIDKPNRYAAWDNAEANGHDIKGIKSKGDTTCSQLVSMVLRAIGTPKKYAPRHMDIAVMTKVMPTNPDFTCYKSTAYTKKSDKLLPGDILLSSHHTAIVVKSPLG